MRKCKWTIEVLRCEALRYSDFTDFRKNGRRAFMAAKRLGVLEEIGSHLKRSRFCRTDEELATEALKYNTRREFQDKGHGPYEVARGRGILDKICAHMTPTETLRSKPRPELRIWTTKTLKVEALKYNSRSDFKRLGKGAYVAARKIGVVDEICSHMLVKKRNWTNEEIALAALPFNCRKDFSNGNLKAYDLAHRRGILDQVCSHMRPSTRSSVMERELLETIKEIFAEARTISDHRVKIASKPHIKRFEIDIFVRSKMKGIEFDGTYHHSFKMLKSRRLHWPDEDVRNYHEIKDSWFASKGIQILHIKEEDWIADKEDCIRRCLEFLLKP